MKSLNETGDSQDAPTAMPESDTNKDREQRPQGHGEVGGPAGLEPTRYGDWEKGGRCIDF